MLAENYFKYSSTLYIRYFKAFACTICMGDFTTFTKVGYKQALFTFPQVWLLGKFSSDAQVQSPNRKKSKNVKSVTKQHYNEIL